MAPGRGETTSNGRSCAPAPRACRVVAGPVALTQGPAMVTGRMAAERRNSGRDATNPRRLRRTGAAGGNLTPNALFSMGLAQFAGAGRSIPLRYAVSIGGYVLKQPLLGRKRYPLVLMLEPLFRCNLACAGCGKIDYPDPILNRRLSVDECLAAVDECGAPMVAIPGGEPLIHKDIGAIVKGIVARKKFVSLCTNALLLEKKLSEFEPSPYLWFSVHLDGLREQHDQAVSQKGVFDRAISAIKAAKARGFEVNVNATIFDGHSAEDVAAFMDFAKELDVGVTISPGSAYERAPDQEHFLSRRKTKELFRRIFALGRGKGWNLGH